MMVVTMVMMMMRTMMMIWWCDDDDDDDDDDGDDDDCTWGSTLEVPVGKHTRNFKKRKKCVCGMGSFPDLIKLGTHGGLV